MSRVVDFVTKFLQSVKTNWKVYAAVFVTCLAFATYIRISNSFKDAEIAALKSTMAEKDTTIQVAEGVVARLVSENADLEKSLDKSRQEVKVMVDAINKNNEKLQYLADLTIKIKKQVAKIEATQDGDDEDIPESDLTPPGVQRKKVNFKHDFGVVGVEGYTLSDPPEATLSIYGTKPLSVAVALTQLEDLSWKTYATSSDKNFDVNINLTKISPFVRDKRWFEKIELNADTVFSGGGAAFGIGIGYQLSQAFSIGARATLASTGDVFYGPSLTWRPFSRK